MNMTDAIPFEQVRREIQIEISSKKHIAEEATILKPAKVSHRAKVLKWEQSENDKSIIYLWAL